jgi:hypothetical protein
VKLASSTGEAAPFTLSSVDSYRNSIEQFNFYREEFADVENKVPECIKPFMDEITAFTEVSVYSRIESVSLTPS